MDHIVNVPAKFQHQHRQRVVNLLEDHHMIKITINFVDPLIHQMPQARFFVSQEVARIKSIKRTFSTVCKFILIFLNYFPT